MAQKPIVRFTRMRGIADEPHGMCALLDGVRGHTGAFIDGNDVRTSRIVRIEFGSDGRPDFIETANTLYLSERR